jgi:AcrR family transcriptional regulator
MVDPRIKRTRAMLQQALMELLEKKDFANISVQDLTNAATVNRATFYDHYTDKFALLECMVANRFQALLEYRCIDFGSCGAVMKGLILAVCDYLAEWHGKVDPHVETAIVAVVRRGILEGLLKHPPLAGPSPEVRSAMVSGAICGAAKEWIATPDRAPSEEIAEQIAGITGLMLAPMDHSHMSI